MRLTPFTPDTQIAVSFTERRTFVATLHELAQFVQEDVDDVVAAFNDGRGQSWLNENHPEALGHRKTRRIDCFWAIPVIVSKDPR